MPHVHMVARHSRRHRNHRDLSDCGIRVDHTGGVQVRLDGTLLPLGIVGQILMTYGYRSQWVAWIILDVIKVVIWFNQLSAGGPGACRCSFFRWSCWPTVFTVGMGLVPQEQHVWPVIG